jgi:hypothetical protein
VLYQFGRGPYDGLIIRPEEPCQCDVSECDSEASTMSKAWPTRGCRLSAKGRGGGVENRLCHYVIPSVRLLTFCGYHLAHSPKVISTIVLFV